MSDCDRPRELWVSQLGTVPYREALALQERLAEARRADRLPDTLLILEHPLVFTRGRRSTAEELPFPEDFYRRQNIDLVDVNRGGKLTCHAPGQLVGYPIMAVSDVRLHLRSIESALIAALADEGLAGRSRREDGPDYTGVWVEDRKIASIGIHLARGVSTHGFALNASNDLEPFSWMVPCGLPHVAMTSIARERSPAGHPVHAVDLHRLRRRLADRFAEVHGRPQRLLSPARLHDHLDAILPAPPLAA